jgi:hypothetical protein
VALKIRALEDGDWVDIKPGSPLYGRRFDEIRISGSLGWPGADDWRWLDEVLAPRMAPHGEVIFGGS